MADHELFTRNDRVVWREQDDPTSARSLREFRLEWGEGPFLVEYVHNLEEGEPGFERHSQMLSVRIDSSLMGLKPFSGFWFIKAGTLH